MITSPLYSLPQGMDMSTLETNPQEIEIEIVSDEEVTTFDKDGNPVAREEPEITPADVAFDANLAVTIGEIEEGYLDTLATDLLEDYENDLSARDDWEKTYANGLKLLGLKYEERTEPWSGACGTFSPILTEAVVRFQSETIMETFPASGPVKTQILGKKTVKKEEAARRVQEDMNYEMTQVMVEYRPEHEKMLWNLPIAGSAFKKVYFDPNLGRQTSVFVPAEEVVLPYGVAEIFSAPRITHRMRKTKNELLKLQQAGFYRDIDIGEPVKAETEIQKRKDKETGFSANNDDRYTVLEMHVEVALKGEEDKGPNGEPTGIMYPYVVTILKDNGKILSIYRNWVEDDENKLKRQHFVHYQYIPGFGSYGFGLIHLIGSAAQSATSLIRQLVDAGTLANLPGGLKARGLRIKGDDTPISPGEFRDVDVPSGTVRDNIMPLPYKEPSQTLLALLNQIVDEARRFAATADMKVSDMSAQAPVGTTLALLERQLKIMSAVQARIHYNMKQELGIISRIIRDNMSDEYDYDPETGIGRSAKKDDYEYTDILPVSDPNASTMSQRVVQYQAAIQLSEKAPQVYDVPRLHRQMLGVLGIPNAEKLVKLPEDAKPQDPVMENMNVLRMTPIKAFAYQDHEAHMQCHQAFMQDPKIAIVLGQNPNAQAMMAQLQAHIAEHAAFSYRAQIEQQLGIPLPEINEDDEAPVSMEDEKELASLIAQAAQRTLLQNQAQAAQQQAQQEAQNPEIQLQQEELRLKQLEMERKARNDQYDYDLGMARLRIEDQRLKADSTLKAVKIAADAKSKDQDRQARQQSEFVNRIANANNANRGGNKPTPRKKQ